MFDVLIRGGSVVDGSGCPAYRADIGVVGDRVCDIGAIPPEAQAARTIDATDKVVAPGFIDIHTHADIALLARPEHLPKIMQGVTTEVFTNCGLGFAPVTEAGLDIQRKYIAGLFGDEGGDTTRPDGVRVPRVDWNWRTVADFLGRFERQGVGANIVYLVPHGALRVSAMGMEERPATAAELQGMCSLLSQALEEGAWGMSTGIWYAPMRAAEREELVTLCRLAGFFATHQRDYGDAIFAATQESLEIAQEAGVPVQIAHLQMNGAGNAGRAAELLAKLEKARAVGVDVTCDTYPYTAGSTFVQSLLPAWAIDGGPDMILRRLSEPETRMRIVADLSAPLVDWSRYNLVGAESPTNHPFEGRSFTEIAQARSLRVAELVCAVLEEEQLRACFVHHAAHEGNVQEILRWSGQMVGSDGLHLPGKTHPRLYGTFPRVLGRYVRDERVLPLEQAVHKMTGMPAARLGLSQRGMLKEGYSADMVVFDPATICDNASFDDPLRFPTGITHVMVNGIMVKEDDQSTGARPGKVLRRT